MTKGCPWNKIGVTGLGALTCPHERFHFVPRPREAPYFPAFVSGSPVGDLGTGGGGHRRPRPRTPQEPYPGRRSDPARL